MEPSYLNEPGRALPLLAGDARMIHAVKDAPDRARSGSGRCGWGRGRPVLVVLVLVAGCRQPVTRFEIENHRQVGVIETFAEDFDTCYYRVKPDGNLDIVARAESREIGEADAIIQIIHLRTVFRAIPGRTSADRTMINGLVHYAVLGPGGAVCFEGAGFVIAREKRDVLRGKLELSHLTPLRRVGRPGEIFTKAVVSGQVVATHDPERTVALLNELHRLFGELPDHVQRQAPPPI